MEDKREIVLSLKNKIKKMLETLQMEQERKPLRLALQFGYLSYVRLFVESQKRESLQKWFPYAGFSDGMDQRGRGNGRTAETLADSVSDSILFFYRGGRPFYGAVPGRRKYKMDRRIM